MASQNSEGRKRKGDQKTRAMNSAGFAERHRRRDERDANEIMLYRLLQEKYGDERGHQTDDDLRRQIGERRMEARTRESLQKG